MQRIFKIYKGKKFTNTFFKFFIFNNILAKIRSTGVISEGPDGRFDTEYSQIMSYFYVICLIWHKMSYYYKWSIWLWNMTWVNLVDLGV